MYNHNKAQQSKNRVHISWDILYVVTYPCPNRDSGLINVLDVNIQAVHHSPIK